MSDRFLDAIKDFVFIVISTFIITALLNYIDPDLTFKKYWSKLGHLNWVNIYESQNLNGLIVLGFLLGSISFIYDIFFSKASKSDSK